jgi:hypothetical protein
MIFSLKASQHSGLNRGPTVYKTVALPLSYVGVVVIYQMVGGIGLEPMMPEGGRFTVSCDGRYTNHLKKAPEAGFEPTTTPLTAVCSTVELFGN